MNDEKIKDIFDNIKADDLTKARMLKNIEEQAKKELLDNERKELLMSYKKIGALAASALILIGGLTLYNIKSNTLNPQDPASYQPPVGEEYVPDKEFNNLNLEALYGNVSKIEIKNHTNDTSFKTISNENTINNIVKLVQTATVKDMTDEVYEKIATSQAEGNSVTVSFILNDGTVSSTRVNLDLNIISINDAYNDVSSELIDELTKELSSIPNLNDINKPSQGM
ncbi:hypothetical protein [Clostridium sp.]|uniref:hypothetical protein n=1 Tax=Clostridium sp. TaxID=1506 RepID=UPI003F66ED00